MNTQTPNPQSILLAMDGSEHAFEAIRLLKDLPLPRDSCITALGVLSPLAAPEHHLMEHILEETEKRLAGGVYRVETLMRLGYPAEIIGQVAEERRPDLILLGAKGLRATLGILLGGVAQQVLEYAVCPVLVVRAPYRGLRRVLLVTDGSSHSQFAARFLAQFPLPGRAEIQIMHVVPPVPRPEWVTRAWPDLQPEAMRLSQTAFNEMAALQARLDKEGQDLLQKAAADLAARGVRATPILATGDAATEIIAHSNSRAVDLIVAGSRGLSSMASWLLGSVSRKLVHYAHCSVLIVKQPAHG